MRADESVEFGVLLLDLKGSRRADSSELVAAELCSAPGARSPEMSKAARVDEMQKSG